MPSSEISEPEHRVSLIMFEGKTCTIRTWWINESRYALLNAALGDPEVDSVYDRDGLSADLGAHVIEGP